MTSPLSVISAGSFFHGVDARIFVVGLARHHGSGDEFDFVDQAKFDRGNAHLAGEWRGRGECEFHGVSFKESKAFLFWVMAGLVPAIHVFLAATSLRRGCPGQARA